MKIHLGYEQKSGESVDIELSQTSPHIAIFGQTGLGKTVLVRRIINEIPKDYRVLVFDTRQGVEEFAGEGHRLPIYVRETTDALVLKGLLESIIQASLKREYATLVQVVADCDTYEEVITKLSARIADKKTHAIVRDMMVLLRDLLQRLMAEMEQTETASDVELAPGLNVMAINERSKQFKQLVVRAVLPLVYRKYRKLVVFLDEGQEYIPQMYSSAAVESVDDYIRTARGKDDYLVIAAQSITGTKKDPLKQVHNWVHFGQATLGEAKEALDYIPHAERMKLTRRELQTMSMGFAIVSTKAWGKRVYIQPEWLPDAVAIRVARGELDAKATMHQYEKQVKVVRVDEEERRHLKSEIQKWTDKAEGLDTDVKALQRKLEEREFDVKTLRDELAKMREQLANKPVAKFKFPDVNRSLSTGVPSTNLQVTGVPPMPAIVEGDINLNDLAAKVADMVEPRILAKIPAGQRVEVPPPRVILQGLLGECVERVKGKVAALNVTQKKMLAYCAAKKTTQKYTDVQRAVVGYTSGPYREQLVAIRETGLLNVDTQHSTVRYAGKEYAAQELRAQYDLTDEDVERVLAAIENEFAHMMG